MVDVPVVSTTNESSNNSGDSLSDDSGKISSSKHDSISSSESESSNPTAKSTSKTNSTANQNNNNQNTKKSDDPSNSNENTKTGLDSSSSVNNQSESNPPAVKTVKQVAQTVPPLVRGNGFERGIFIFFDPSTWQKVRKEWIVYYEMLEERGSWLSLSNSSTSMLQNAVLEKST